MVSVLVFLMCVANMALHDQWWADNIAPNCDDDSLSSGDVAAAVVVPLLTVMCCSAAIVVYRQRSHRGPLADKQVAMPGGGEAVGNPMGFPEEEVAGKSFSDENGL